jgi:putative ATP-binding cassette transporter
MHKLRFDLDAVNNLLLQSDVNLEARRGQCVLISGPSGCGKTSLFRICAGLRPIDAKRLVLPKRQHLLFIPQRPYLPLGSLRLQTLFFLKNQNNMNDKDLYQLFQIVNLQYLLERYTFDTIVDWSKVLSVGEQQRLAFIRLFALFTLSPNSEQLRRETLVLFDESTSAIDAKTEEQIYTQLIQLQIWFVTISHRPSLVHLHTKSLQFSSNKNRQQSIEQSISIASSFENNDENKLLKDEINQNESIDTTNIRVDIHFLHFVLCGNNFSLTDQ